MISIFKKINNKKHKHYEQENYNPYVSNNLVFMWGVKSRDDFTNNSANIFTTKGRCFPNAVFPF